MTWCVMAVRVAILGLKECRCLPLLGSCRWFSTVAVSVYTHTPAVGGTSHCPSPRLLSESLLGEGAAAPGVLVPRSLIAPDAERFSQSLLATWFPSSVICSDSLPTFLLTEYLIHFQRLFIYILGLSPLLALCSWKTFSCPVCLAFFYFLKTVS